MDIPKLNDIVFFPYSSILDEPLICANKICQYICIFVDYFPTAYPTAIEMCYMKDLVEFAQSRHVETIVISFANKQPVSFFVQDYINHSSNE